MSETRVTVTDLDGDPAIVETYPGYDSAILSVQTRFFRADRAAAVALIEALTDAVEAHDAEEARKAEAAAKEAAKLKAGDIVRLKGIPTSTRVVITDEDSRGRVDLVTLTDDCAHLVGGIQRRKYARSYERI